MSIFRIHWRLAETYTCREAIADESMVRAVRALQRFHTVCKPSANVAARGGEPAWPTLVRIDLGSPLAGAGQMASEPRNISTPQATQKGSTKANEGEAR
jgi:hypothetical protein